MGASPTRQRPCAARLLAAPRAARSVAVSALLGVLISIVPGVGSAATNRLVVVPMAAPKAAKLEPVVGPLLIKPLRQDAIIVPTATFWSAARRLGMAAAQASAVPGAVRIGRAVDATHVLLVKTSADRDLRSSAAHPRMVYASRVTLLEVASGRTLVTRRLPMASRVFSAGLARSMLAEVRPHLAAGRPPKGAGAPPARPASRAAPPPPPLEPLPVAGARAPKLNKAARQAKKSPQVDAFGQPIGFPLPDTLPPDVPFGSTAPPEQAVPVPEIAPVAAMPPSTAIDRSRYRPPVRLLLGPNVFLREGHILSPNLNPPSYAPRARRRASPFTRVVLQADIFFLAFDGIGSWYEGFGMHVDGNLGAARTRLPDGSLVTSVLGGAGIAGQYRWVLFSSRFAPSLTPAFGGTTFSFPLSGSQFPGVGYKSYYAGLTLDIPAVPDLLSFTFRGNYLPRVVGFGGTAHLGRQVEAGRAYQLQGSFHFLIADHLLLGLMAELNHYDVPFFGNTALNNSERQYRNVRLTDHIRGLSLDIGLTF